MGIICLILQSEIKRVLVKQTEVCTCFSKNKKKNTIAVYIYHNHIVYIE